MLPTPPEIIKEFNTLVFQFLWNGKDKVTRRSTYAPYDSGGIRMVDYENMIKALRLGWLKKIVDHGYNCFWKLYLSDLLSSHGGLFLLDCNYDVVRLNTYPIFIMNSYCGDQNYEMLLIVMVNINISFGTIEKLR